MTPLLAEKLLRECEGNQIWSLDTCRQAGIPEAWIEELQDGYESGYAHDRQTIYHEGRPVNQFEGCRDLHLAFKLAEYLGIATERFWNQPAPPEYIVTQLKLELDEL